LVENNNISRARFEQLYRKESNADTKERMLLVLNVVYDKHIPAQITKDLHRSRTWASDWLKRYKEEGIEGLRDRPKSGRPPDIPKVTIYKIKNELLSSKQGWTTKQVYDIIVRESGIHYHHIYIYTLLRRWGFKQKVPRKVHVNTASKEDQERFKKEQERYWILSITNNNNKKKKKKKNSQ
jgi:putative transposase